MLEEKYERLFGRPRQSKKEGSQKGLDEVDLASNPIPSVDVSMTKASKGKKIMDTMMADNDDEAKNSLLLKGIDKESESNFFGRKKSKF